MTDVSIEGRDNRIELDIDGMAADQFLGPWLESPGARWDLEDPGIRSVVRLTKEVPGRGMQAVTDPESSPHRHRIRP